jgi:hypothetical protein
MNYTRDTAFGAAALVILLVLYVRGVPQAVYAAVIGGGNSPVDGALAQAGDAAGGLFPSAPSAPADGGKPPGIAPDTGNPTAPAITPPPGTIYPVSAIAGVDHWFSLYKDVKTSDGRSTWYDVIVPCAERTGSFDPCIPRG